MLHCSQKIVILSVVLSCTIMAAFAQTDLRFNHFTTSNGLPDNTVRDIFQDRNGYLWFSTGEGLMKYDGVNKTIYRHSGGDSTTLSSSDVTSVCEDNSGNIWVGTSEGLNMIKQDDGSVKRFSSLAFNRIFRSQNVTSVSCNIDGTIWVGTSAGLFKYSALKDTFLYVLHRQIINMPALPAAVSYKGISFDTKGNIYTSLAGSIYYSLNKGRSFQELDLQHRTTLPNGEVWISFIKIIDGNLYWSDWGYSHIYCKNLTTGAQKEYVFDKLPFQHPTEVIYDICKTGDDELWLAGVQGIGETTNDVFILNSRTGICKRLKQQPDLFSLHCGNIKSILKDRQGTIWIGGFQGIDYYSEAFSLYKTYSAKKDDPGSYQGGIVNSICKDRSQRIWVGSSNGLSCFNDSSQQFTRFIISSRYSLGNSLNNIDKLFLDSSGLLWIATESQVIQFDTRINKFITAKNGAIKIIYASDATPVVCFAQDHQNNIWMGLWESGLLKYDQATQKMQLYSKHSTDPAFYIAREWPSSMVVDDNNNLWIGYNDYGGFAKMDLNTRKMDYYATDAANSNINDPIISQLLPLKNNTLMLATNKNGLKVFDPAATNKFYEIKSLISNKISGILQAADKTIWINTPAGLSNLNTVTGMIQNFPVEVAGRQLNSGAFCISNDNKIFLGIDSAFVSFSLHKKKILLLWLLQ